MGEGMTAGLGANGAAPCQTGHPEGGGGTNGSRPRRKRPLNALHYEGSDRAMLAPLREIVDGGSLRGVLRRQLMLRIMT